MIETNARPWRGGVPLNPRTALSELIAKVFSAPFAKTFSAPLGGVAAAAAAGWWLSGGIAAANCIGAYDAKNAANLAASYINLAKPGTYDAFAGTAPTQTPGTGWIGDTTKYLKTGIVYANNQTWSMFVQFSNLVDNEATKYLIGNISAGGAFIIGLSTANVQAVIGVSNGGSAAANTAEMLSGNLGVAGTKGYKNGADIGVTIGTGGTANSVAIYLMALNNYNTLYAPMNGVFIAAAIYNTTITAPQITALATAMAAL